MSVTRPRPIIPEDLPKLLHDLSYSVIKDNPKDIIAFAAEFFQQLYTERELQRSQIHDRKKASINRSFSPVSDEEK